MKPSFTLYEFFALLTAVLLAFPTQAEDAQPPAEAVEEGIAVLEEQTEVEEVIRSDLNFERMQQLAVAEEAKKKEVLWLDVLYPNSEIQTKVLALQLKPRTPNVQGAVLLLHGANQHANWPAVIRPLRESLPEQGWHTFSLALPHLTAEKKPDRSLEAKTVEQVVLTPVVSENLLKSQTHSRTVKDETTEESEEATDLTATEPVEVAQEDEQEEAVDIDLASSDAGLSYDERALAHVEAAMERLKSEGYQNIVMISLGLGANVALQYVKPRAEKMPSQGFAIVMIEPQLDDEMQEDMGIAFAKNFRSPVLDIYDQVSIESRERSKERMIAARLALMQDYSQLKLNSNDFAGRQNGLVRRVSQWMMKHAPGMQAQQYRLN